MVLRYFYFVFLLFFSLNVFAQEPRLVLPVGHTGKINSAVFSPDDKYILTTSDDNTARLYEFISGKEIQIMKMPELVSAEFSPDGKNIILLSNNKSAKIFKYGDKIEEEYFENYYAKSKDWKFFITKGQHENLEIVDFFSGTKKSILTQNPKKIKSAKLSNDSKIILIEFSDSTLTIWDILLNKEMKYENSSFSNIGVAEISPDCKYLLTKSCDSTLHIYDINTGVDVLNLRNVEFTKFSPSGKYLICNANDSTIIIESKSGSQIIKTYINYDKISTFNEEENLFFRVSGEEIEVFNIKLREKIHNLDCAVVKDSMRFRTIRIPNVESMLDAIVLSRDGNLLSTASFDGVARIWDIRTGKLLNLFRHDVPITSTNFNKNNNFLIVACHDGKARIWDVNNWNVFMELGGKTLSTNYLSFDKKTNYVFTGNYVNANVFELFSGKKLSFLKGHINYINNVKIAEEGNYVFTSSWDHTVRVWDKTTCVELYCINDFSHRIIDLDISSNNKYFIVASWDNTSRIYDIKTGKELSRLLGHDEEILSACFSPDNKYAVTTSRDGYTRIWDILSGNIIKEIPGLYAFFSNDSKLIITVSNVDNVLFGYTIQTWEVKNWKILNSLDSPVSYIDDFVMDSLELLNLEKERIKTFENNLISRDSFFMISFIDPLYFNQDSYILDANSIKKIIVHELLYVSTLENGCILFVYDSVAVFYDYNNGIELKRIKGNNLKFSSDGTLALEYNAKSQIVKIFGTDKNNNSSIIKLKDEFLEPDYNFSDNLQFISNKFIIGYSKDNKTIIWDAKTGKQLYTRLQLKNGDWLVYDEHNRYDGSQGARDYLYFVCGLEVVDLAQVKDALYVPNLVQRIMNGENLDHLPKLKDLEICGVTPEVEQIENKKDGGYYYQIKPRKGGVGKVEIYINGMLRQTIDSKTLPQKNGIYELKVDEKLIAQYQIVDKETEIKVIARTADNKISSRGAILEVVTETKTYRKPDLHAIMVGIDDYKGEGLDLNYAAKDAIDLQTALESSAKKFFNTDDTNRVHFYNLTVNRAGTIGGLTPDRNNILQTIDKIANNSKPEDVLLLFFAGHGDVNQDKNFILLTADASRDQAPNFVGITMKELLEKLAKVPAGKRVLILDACNSGAAINELKLNDIAGLRDSEDAEKQSRRLKELENLASKSGLAIITASTSEQKAMELHQYEHGLMTYALLSTMMNESNALDKDNNLQLQDWFRETEKSVAKLVENQSAQIFTPLNFSIGKVDEQVRKSIILREIPTLVLANVMNLETADDDLDLKTQLNSKLNEFTTRGSIEKIRVELKDSPKAISINLSYELNKNIIKTKIVLKKEKKAFKQFNFEGDSSNLNKFVEDLSEELIKNLN